MTSSKTRQLEIFEKLAPSDRDPSSILIALYDGIPKYVFRSGETMPLQINRTFRHAGKEYRLQLKAAILSENRIKYPGAREELVEDALRKMAVDGYGINTKERVGVAFTYYELRKKLSDAGHTFSLQEIKEALEILGNMNFQVEAADGKTKATGRVFEMVGSTTDLEELVEIDGNTRAVVVFNLWVSEAVNSLRFRIIDYDTMMSIKSILGRWLFKTMSHNFVQASLTEKYTILLTTVIQNSGMTTYRSLGENLRRVEEAIKGMQKMKLVASYQVEKRYSGKKVIDALISIRPGPKFVTAIKKANAISKDLKEHKPSELP